MWEKYSNTGKSLWPLTTPICVASVVVSISQAFTLCFDREELLGSVLDDRDLWLLQVEIRGLHTAEKSEWCRKMDCVYIACIRWMYPHTTLKGQWCSWVDYKAVSTTCRGQDVHADRSTDTYTKCARTCSCTHIGTNISHSTALQWTEGMCYIFSLRHAEKVCDEISKSFCTLRWCVSF